MKMRFAGLTFPVISLLCLSIITILGCNGGETGMPKNLGPVEIKEYQGEQLSSANDFSENSISGPQSIKIENYTLNVGGHVENPLKLTYDEVINKYQHYKKVVTLDCVEGWSVKILWEGFLLKDFIRDAGLSSDVKTIIFYAYDGYSTSFPIEYVMDNDIMIAYKMNDIIIPAERGYPFLLVAESKWGYKWVKWITNIELSDRTDFKGYWESRGYANDGDLDKPFFD
jgi:DMSO/TMAO reductase YedYZ molybdopterin-dependent catalytic subunit